MAATAKKQSQSAPKPAPKPAKSRLHYREQPGASGCLDETVGGDLQALREAAALSIEEVAQRLKLRPGDIAAIERSDFDSLPGKTYALGFVRSYATLVREVGEAEEYVRRFKAEMTQSEELKFNSITRRDPGKGIPWALIVTALVVVGLAVMVWQTAREASLEAEQTLEAFEPALPVLAEPGTERALIEDAAPSAGTVASSLPDGIVWGQENYDGRVRIKALEPSWLRAEVDGHVMFERVLPLGESYIPPAAEDVRIITRNAANLEIWVDGGYIRRLEEGGENLSGQRLDADALLGSQD